MNRLLLVVSLFFVVSCSSSTSPVETPEPHGPTGTYHYHHTLSNGMGIDSIAYGETLTFIDSLAKDSVFVGRYQRDGALDTEGVVVKRQSDGDFVMRADCPCAQTPIPIVSHRTYGPELNTIYTPTKNNGFVAEGSISKSSKYIGPENIFIGLNTYRCSKVQYDVTIRAASGEADGALQMTRISTFYWYSPEVGYFVKELQQELDSTSSGTLTKNVYVRDLTSFSH